AGRSLQAGQRFGLIRFGSRGDVYLPDGVAPLVCVGQRSVAGETVLADTKSDESGRLGEARETSGEWECCGRCNTWGLGAMRRTRLRDHSINRLIPNMLTLFALCAGLTSIKFALDANELMNMTAYTGASSVADAAARKWELACIAIIVAAVFDALDGRI